MVYIMNTNHKIIELLEYPQGFGGRIFFNIFIIDELRYIRL